MEEKQTVDVLIPCAGSAEYFEEAINSVINQSYKNLAIYVIDNSSEHTKYKYITENKRDENIYYIRFDQRLSMTENWQRCLTIGHSQYVAFLHDDDIWEHSYIENSISKLSRNGKAEICLTGHIYFSGNNEEISVDSTNIIKKKLNITDSYSEPSRSFLISTSNSGHMSALLFKRTSLGFPINSRWLPDQEFLTAYSAYNNLLINSEVLVHIRLSKKNVTSSMNTKGFITIETINHLRRTIEFYVRNRNLTPEILINTINDNYYGKGYKFRLLQACFSWPLKTILITFGADLILLKKNTNINLIKKSRLLLRIKTLLWVVACLIADLKYFLKDFKNNER